jgi:hypothetical protein
MNRLPRLARHPWRARCLLPRHRWQLPPLLIALAVLTACAEEKTTPTPPLKLSADAKRQRADQYLRDADVVVLFRSWDDIKISRPAIMYQGELHKLNRQSADSALRLMRAKTGVVAVQFDPRYNQNQTRRTSEYPDLDEIRSLIQSAGFPRVVFLGAGPFGDFLISE